VSFAAVTGAMNSARTHNTAAIKTASERDNFSPCAIVAPRKTTTLCSLFFASQFIPCTDLKSTSNGVVVWLHLRRGMITARVGTRNFARTFFSGFALTDQIDKFFSGKFEFTNGFAVARNINAPGWSDRCQHRYQIILVVQYGHRHGIYSP